MHPNSRFICLLLVAAFACPLSAQIRDFVPVVRPVYHEETVSFLEKLSESMKKDGYDDAAALLKAYAQGGFGSGFVIVAQDGTAYVATNRHVLSQAASVTIEFQKADGSQTVYKNCQVLAVDEDLDLALVSFPTEAKPFKAGLAFAGGTVEDGLEVWSAGYPGLGKEPAWQLGKGNVTNGSAKVAELADPAITLLIQHSAQVDPGNSGGPLLVADKASLGGYKVVGINTWKAFDRQATNFSIPSSAIQRFVDTSLARDTEQKPQALLLETRCRDFISAAAKKEEAYKSLARYISYGYVASDGEAILKKALSVAPTQVRNDILAVFSGVSPIEGIRLAIAYEISSSLAGKDGPAPLGFVAVDGNAEAEGTAVPVRLTREGTEISLSWLREHGVWRLASYPLDAKTAGKQNDEKKKGTASVTFDDSPYTVLFSLGSDLALGSGGENIWEIGLALVPDCYVAFNTAVAFRSSSYDDGYESTEGALVRIKGGIRAQLPVRGSHLALLPFAGLGAGMIIDTSNIGAGGVFSLAEGGLQLGIGEEPSLYLGAAYRSYLFAPEGIDDASSIALSLGFGF